jgi:hypothetical protein
MEAGMLAWGHGEGIKQAALFEKSAQKLLLI